MSTNPARTFGSALHAGYWQALWIYFVAPTMGMLVAGEVFLRLGAVSLLIAGSSTTPITNAASFTHGEPRTSAIQGHRKEKQ